MQVRLKIKCKSDRIKKWYYVCIKAYIFHTFFSRNSYLNYVDIYLFQWFELNFELTGNSACKYEAYKNETTASYRYIYRAF